MVLKNIILKQKYFLFFLFFASFITRILFFGFYLSNNNKYWNYDTRVYHQVAQQISNGNGIKNEDGSCHFYRVPGYSLFLAACYKFFDFDLKKALLIQAFLASLIPLLIFFISLILFPNSFLLAKLSSFLSIVHLGYLVFSGIAMTEIFFVFFFYLFLIFFLNNLNLFFCKKSNLNIFLKQLFLAGVFLGLASMFRPVGHYLIFSSMFLILVSSLDWVANFRKILFLFMGWFLIVFTWLLRNWLLTGCIFFHTLSGVHFLKHLGARVLMNQCNCSYSVALQNLNNEWNDDRTNKEKQLNRKISEIENCILAENITIKYLKKNPLLSLKHCFINMFKTCFSLFSAELLFIDSGGKLPSYSNKRTVKDILFRFLFPDTNNFYLKIIIYLEILFMFYLWLGFVGFIFKSFLNLDYFCVLAKTFTFIFIFVFISLACGFARLRLSVECFLIILSLRFWIDCFYKKTGMDYD
ncbi:hypothetical protein ACFLYH_01985 [Candidatus Dependentiae bacterium]